MKWSMDAIIGIIGGRFCHFQPFSFSLFFVLFRCNNNYLRNNRQREGQGRFRHHNRRYQFGNSGPSGSYYDSTGNSGPSAGR